MKNTVGKGENAGDRQFILFQRFQVYQTREIITAPAFTLSSVNTLILVLCIILFLVKSES